MILHDRFRLSPLYHRLRPFAQRLELLRWDRNGRPVPVPHLVKQRLVAAYASRFGLRTLVETGTFLGSMVWEMRGRFDRVVSIELDERLASHARRLFSSDRHVTILRGDSGELLPGVVRDLHGAPALFWLDAHHSFGMTARGPLSTPIRAELRALGGAPAGSLALVDDAHLFDGTDDYPALEELGTMVSAASFEVEDNVIRITGLTTSRSRGPAARPR